MTGEGIARSYRAGWGRTGNLEPPIAPVSDASRVAALFMALGPGGPSSKPNDWLGIGSLLVARMATDSRHRLPGGHSL